MTTINMHQLAALAKDPSIVRPRRCPMLDSGEFEIESVRTFCAVFSLSRDLQRVTISDDRLLESRLESAKGVAPA